jgi:hypothetical protein
VEEDEHIIRRDCRRVVDGEENINISSIRIKRALDSRDFTLFLFWTGQLVDLPPDQSIRQTRLEA